MMTENRELTEMPAVELAAHIKRRKVSPVEVVEAFIERLEARNRELNAFVFLEFEEARRRARDAEQAVTAGESLGPLHGVPTAMKDLFDFKPGWISTLGGIRALKDHVVDSYCIFAERIERAGAIILGKTNSPVMGFRGTCDNYLFGPCRNPFDMDRNSGGSSGGSAAAVADRLVPFAEGTDAGGSIRIPAAWCGVYGYMPSFGRVPAVTRPNAFGATAPFLFTGPITRTVEDAAAVLNALAGYDPRDPFSLETRADFSTATRSSVKGWKIAYSPNFDVFPVDPRVARVVEQAVLAFEEDGARVEQVHLGIRRPHREWSDLWCRLNALRNLATLENLERNGLALMKDYPGDFPPQYLDWIDQARRLTIRDTNRDQEMRTEVYDAVQGILGRYELLVTPTVACPAVQNATDGNTVGPSSIDGQEIDPLIGWALTYFVNFSGNPAASIPAGMVEGRLPVGMQIIGRRYADAKVLTASAVFEKLRPWAQS